mgnify:CR=1 FL=1
MKTILKLVFFCLFIITVVSCNDNDSLDAASEVIIIQLAETKIVGNKNISIQFSKVLEDSRCPENLVCIWGGRAVIELLLNNTDKQLLGIGDLKTGVQKNYVNSFKYKGYEIQLLDLKPYNNTTGNSGVIAYTISLKVEKR